MASDPIQTAFIGGELSKRLRGRVGSDLYKVGLALCENFEPTPQGSLRNRNGSRFVASLGDPTYRRLIDFPMIGQPGYLIELRPGQLRVFTEDGLVPQMPVAELITDSMFNNAAAWTFALDAGIDAAEYRSTNTGTYGYFATTGASGFVRQAVTVPGAGKYTLRFACSGGSGFATFVVNVRVGTVPGGSSLLSKQDSIAWNTNHHRSYDFNAAGAGIVYVEFYAANGAGFLLTDVSVKGPVDDYIAAPWGASLAELQYVVDPSSSVNQLIFVHPYVAPQKLVLSNGRWTLSAITFTGKPAEWANYNWPRAAELFQGRLYLGGPPDQPATFWASRTGSVFDFTEDATDPRAAFHAQIAGKGSARWFLGAQVLLIGTDIGEYSVNAANGVIGVSDVETRPESAHGSAGWRALKAGSQALYVSPDWRKVRAINFNLQRNAWESKDLTFIGEHVTLAGIREAHYLRDPDGIIVLLLADGTLACCTYNAEEQVAAWWRITMLPRGSIKAITAVHGSRGSRLWLVVHRVVDGYAPFDSLEFIDFGEEDAPCFLDCAKVYAVPGGATPTISVTHLGNGEGFTGIKAVVDGVVDDAATLDPYEGAIILSRAGTSALVGFAYTATAKTLPPETGNPRGTSQRMTKRWARVVARLVDAQPPKLNGERAVLVAGTDYGVTGSLDYDSQGAITLEQDSPYRTEVLGLFGTAQGSEV